MVSPDVMNSSGSTAELDSTKKKVSDSVPRASPSQMLLVFLVTPKLTFAKKGCILLNKYCLPFELKLQA